MNNFGKIPSRNIQMSSQNQAREHSETKQKKEKLATKEVGCFSASQIMEKPEIQKKNSEQNPKLDFLRNCLQNPESRNQGHNINDLATQSFLTQDLSEDLSESIVEKIEERDFTPKCDVASRLLLTMHKGRRYEPKTQPTGQNMSSKVIPLYQQPHENLEEEEVQALAQPNRDSRTREAQTQIAPAINSVNSIGELDPKILGKYQQQLKTSLGIPESANLSQLPPRSTGHKLEGGKDDESGFKRHQQAPIPGGNPLLWRIPGAINCTDIKDKSKEYIAALPKNKVYIVSFSGGNTPVPQITNFIQYHGSNFFIGLVNTDPTSAANVQFKPENKEMVDMMLEMLEGYSKGALNLLLLKQQFFKAYSLKEDQYNNQLGIVFIPKSLVILPGASGNNQ